MQQLQRSNVYVWCGQQVQLIPASTTQADASPASTNIELQMQAGNLPTNAVSSISCNMYLLPAPTSGRGKSLVRNVAGDCLAAGGVVAGVAVTFSSVSSWDEADSHLRGLWLVHPDACVHVEVNVSHIA